MEKEKSTVVVEYVNEGRGPSLEDVIADTFKANSGQRPLYFYQVDEVVWLVSDEPITNDVAVNMGYME